MTWRHEQNYVAVGYVLAAKKNTCRQNSSHLATQVTVSSLGTHQRHSFVCRQQFSHLATQVASPKGKLFDQINIWHATFIIWHMSLNFCWKNYLFTWVENIAELILKSCQNNTSTNMKCIYKVRPFCINLIPFPVYMDFKLQWSKGC